MISCLYAFKMFSSFDYVLIPIFLFYAAGLLNWSLISFVNLTTSLVLRFTAPKRGRALAFGLELLRHIVTVIA